MSANVPDRPCFNCGTASDAERGWWKFSQPPYRGFFCSGCLDRGVGLTYDRRTNRLIPTMAQPYGQAVYEAMRPTPGENPMRRELVNLIDAVERWMPHDEQSENIQRSIKRANMALGRYTG